MEGEDTGHGKPAREMGGWRISFILTQSLNCSGTSGRKNELILPPVSSSQESQRTAQDSTENRDRCYYFKSVRGFQARTLLMAPLGNKMGYLLPLPLLPSFLHLEGFSSPLFNSLTYNLRLNPPFTYVHPEIYMLIDNLAEQFSLICKRTI